MLILYRKSDRLVASNSGTNSYLPDGPPFDDEVINAIRAFGGAPADYGEYRLNDEADAALVQSILASGSFELEFDAAGQPVGVRVHPRLTAEATPSAAAMDQIVTITARFPTDTPDTDATFAVEGGAPIVEPIAAGAASHSFAFAVAGTYLITLSSAHHGITWVEVVVQ